MGFHKLLDLSLLRNTTGDFSGIHTDLFNCMVCEIGEEEMPGRAFRKPQHQLKTKPTDLSESKESCFGLMITID